ncbi:DUF4157 domain-containing protein [Desulfobulbus rhabdoformis]|nr:DUF4157 domain-containing protein [Desulfobulbus rhabdoformis]
MHTFFSNGTRKNSVQQRGAFRSANKNRVSKGHSPEVRSILHERDARHQQPPLRASYTCADGLLQTKLDISSPGDACEQEADSVANQVMQASESGKKARSPLQGRGGGSAAATSENMICRMSAEEDELPGKVQRTATPSQTNTMPPHVDAKIQQVLRSGGKRFDGDTRSFMESRFGRDFSQVKIHANQQAEQVAQALQAKAFTLGQDIVFGAQEYAPSSWEGRHLIAHELAHVVQQQSGGASQISRQPDVEEKTAGGESNAPVQPVYSVTTNIKPASKTKSSTTSIDKHTVTGVATKDTANDAWRFQVTSVKGKGTIDIVPYPATHIPNPTKGGNIVNDASLGANGGHYCDVIADLADYTSTGKAGPRWHVTQATIDHENYHWKKEWQPSFNKRWIEGEKKIEKLSVSATTYATADAALKAMQPDADRILKTTKSDAHTEYMALPDGANDPPYKEGQKALNTMIAQIKTFARSQKWPNCA